MQEVGDDLLAKDSGRERPAAATAEDERERMLYLIGGAAFVAVVFLYLQFRTPAILDVDGYYHIKWSRLLWEGLLRGSFPHPFPYLPLTTLNPEDYVDHHLLFHLFLIPFTWFGDLRIGAKAAAVIFGSLGVLSCYWLMLRYAVRYAPVWLLALVASSAPFLFRLSMTRAQTLSIVFLITGIYLLFERRYRWLAPLAFLYVWYYSLFVLLGAAAVLWAATLYWSERRLEWRPVLWTAVGTLAGFVVNPYFPKNIILFVSHVLMKVNPNEFSTSVGAEWYPYDSWYFVGSCAVAFVAMAVGYIGFNWQDWRPASARALFFLLFSSILLIANARSRRFVEYWPPFAVLFAAFALQAMWERARHATAVLPAEVMDDLQPYFDHTPSPAETSPERDRRQWTVAAVVAVLLCVPLLIGLRETGNTISGEQHPHAYRGGAEWLRANAPAGEIVFNTDWDDFPKLFFYDSEHRYASGLDPTYLLEENPQLSKLYESITLGREANPAELIRDRFGARYVFTDNEEIHEELQNKLIESGWFEIAYNDESCTVMRLLDQKREPAADEDANVGEGVEENQETDDGAEEIQTEPL